MNQIIIQIPNAVDTTIQANDIDDAIVKLQNLKPLQASKQFAAIQKFKGITPSNSNSNELDWYNQ